MINHATNETLQAYLDGELTKQESRELEGHLHECPDCAAKMKQLRSLFQSIESLPEEPLTTDFGPAVVEAIRPRRAWLPSLAFGELLVAAAISLGLVLWLGGVELQGRLSVAVEKLVIKMESATFDITNNLTAFFDQVPDAPVLETARFTDLTEAVFTSPTLLWTVAAAAFVFLLLGNGLIMRLGKDNNA